MGLKLVKFLPLMEQTTGRSEVAIGLIDGPVAIQSNPIPEKDQSCGTTRIK
jgi:hypothetical protein